MKFAMREKCLNYLQTVETLIRRVWSGPALFANTFLRVSRLQWVNIGSLCSIVSDKTKQYLGDFFLSFFFFFFFFFFAFIIYFVTSLKHVNRRKLKRNFSSEQYSFLKNVPGHQ